MNENNENNNINENNDINNKIISKYLNNNDLSHLLNILKDAKKQLNTTNDTQSANDTINNVISFMNNNYNTGLINSENMEINDLRNNIKDLKYFILNNINLFVNSKYKNYTDSSNNIIKGISLDNEIINDIASDNNINKISGVCNLMYKNPCFTAFIMVFALIIIAGCLCFYFFYQKGCLCLDSADF